MNGRERMLAAFMLKRPNRVAVSGRPGYDETDQEYNSSPGSPCHPWATSGWHVINKGMYGY